MDNTTLGAAIGIMLGIENTDIARAETAAREAEAAKDIALAKSYGITVQGSGLYIADQTEGGDD